MNTRVDLKLAQSLKLLENIGPVTDHGWTGTAGHVFTSKKVFPSIELVARVYYYEASHHKSSKLTFSMVVLPEASCETILGVAKEIAALHKYAPKW